MNKKIILLLLFIPLLSAALSVVMPVGATAVGQQYSSYIYNSYGKAIAVPEAYKSEEKIYIKNFGINIGKIVDMDSDQNGFLYLIDNENSFAIKYDTASKTVVNTLSALSDGTSLNRPSGICVGNDGYIYIADTENGRIVKLTKDFMPVQVFGKPSLEDAQYDYDYKPLYVEADDEGRFYVIADSQTQGIMQFDEAGKFIGYYGATKVSPSVSELIFRSIASQEQKKQMLRFVPTEYRNMTLDSKGFMYVTVDTYSADEIQSSISDSSTSVTPIRRLNQSGSDILQRNGMFTPVGDIEFEITGNDSLAGASLFVDVVPYKNGIYSVLDSKRGRVFTYDIQGNLLYIFGGRGTDMGMFATPAAIVYNGDDIIVLDKSDNSITCFKQTEYAKSVISGIEKYQSGKYDEAIEVWQDVLMAYPHSVLALTEIGKSELNGKNYKAALDCFKQADNRIYYSKALVYYIREQAGKASYFVLPAVAVLIAVYAVIKQLQKHGKLVIKKRESNFDKKHQQLHKLFGELKYSRYVSTHPFDGFWDLKNEKRGSVLSATVLLILAVAANIIRIRCMPFLFNKTDFTEISAFYQGFISIVIIVLLWCISNWCFTTLMDGKGNMKDIYIYTCYALRPIIILFPFITVLSYALSLQSASFINLAVYIAVVWVGFLIVAGTVSTHQYSFGKAMLSILLTVVGMMIIVFLALLIFSIVQEGTEFFRLLLTEITDRL